MKTAIVLGTFDGLHTGHRAVIEKAQGFFCVAVTFEMPPKSVVTGEPQLLMLPQDREERLKQLGVDSVEMQRFEDVKNIEPEQYLELLKEKYNPQRIICGFNYAFGKNARGDTKMLESFCNKNGIEFICVPPVLDDGMIVSSSYIRDLVRSGNMAKATKHIYGGFAFSAMVEHGDARGRQLGFPTANQQYPTELVKPKFGVYLSQVTVDGVRYDAITNIGVRPTYKTDTVGCETYIKDFSGDIYNKKMTIQLLQFVREEQMFSSVDELKSAIINDVNLLKKRF